MLFNMNLFMSFDMNCFFFSFNSSMMIMMFLSFKDKFSSMKNFYFNVMKEFYKMIFSSMKFNIYTKYKKMKKMKKFISIFMIFSMMNLYSLMIYSFSLTSMFQINMSLILPIWFGSLTLSIYKKTKFFIHLCPSSCPMMLSFFMILIEMMSLIIQPLTLFLRLTINMISGHILIMMISNMMMLCLTYMMISFVSMITLMILKMTVSLIQSYILSILLMMYYSNSNNMI